MAEISLKVQNFEAIMWSVVGILRNRVKALIGRLKELRAALISSFVTGQIVVVNFGKKEQVKLRVDTLEERAIL